MHADTISQAQLSNVTPDFLDYPGNFMTWGNRQSPHRRTARSIMGIGMANSRRLDPDQGIAAADCRSWNLL
jgi:hypothetical protein